MVRTIVNMRHSVANYSGISRVTGIYSLTDIPAYESQLIPVPSQDSSSEIVSNKTCEELVNEKFNILIQCIDDLEFKMTGLITAIDGILPIKESELDEIYNSFIMPFIACEFYKIGTMSQVVNLDKVIKCLIEGVKSAKTKLVLIILKDLLPAILNTRNVFIDNLRLRKETNELQIKYEKAKELIIQLENKIKRLEDTDPSALPTIIGGNLQFETWKPPNFLYIQAKFNLELAWYQFLYNTTKIDTDKYGATVAYIASYDSRENAYNTLINLLDQKFKALEDEIENK